MNVSICKQWLMAWIFISFYFNLSDWIFISSSLILQIHSLLSLQSAVFLLKSLRCNQSLIFGYLDPAVRCQISSTQLEDTGNTGQHRPGGDCRYWPVSAWRQFEVQCPLGCPPCRGSIKDCFLQNALVWNVADKIIERLNKIDIHEKMT